MPELPEVEVLKQSLQPSLVGRRIETVEVWNGALREPIDERRMRNLEGQTFVGIRRRAKYLWLDLDANDTLVVHLGMSGRLTLAAPDAIREAHEHVAIDLDSGQRLRFRDPRRFGLLFVRSTHLLGRDRHFAHLGVEPLGPELTGETLQRRAAGRRGPVKSFLMNGEIVVGVGNIYAAEALFRAGIHPRRSVSRIARPRWDRLASAVRETLEAAISQGGTTLNDFTDAQGERGYFSVSLAVYDRVGEPCSRCGRGIRRIVQTGRSTYYCPGCQH